MAKIYSIATTGNIAFSGEKIYTTTNKDVVFGNNLVPSTSAFYIGDINNPVNGIYLAANTLHLASTTLGVSGLGISNVDNVLTLTTGGFRSSEVYTGGLFISGNNIGADPEVSNLPMTIGTNGLPAVEFLVPIKLKSTTGTPNLSGDACFTGNVSAVAFYGDGSHLTNIPQAATSVGYQDGNQTPIEVLDLTKTVHTFADGTWILNNGLYDGQVMHFVMLDGGSGEDIYVRVSKLREIVNGLDTTVTNVLFRPFPHGGGTNFNTVTTMVYANSAWHPSQGSVVSG